MGMRTSSSSLLDSPLPNGVTDSGPFKANEPESDSRSTDELTIEDRRLAREEAIIKAWGRLDRVVGKIEHGDGERPGPLVWAQDFTETFDEHWQRKGLPSPYRPFPNRPYWPWLFNLFLTERVLFLAKSRDMMASWAAIAYAVWSCMVQPRTRVIVQTQKESKGIELVKGAGAPGYARTLYERQPPALQWRFPLAKPMEDQPATAITWANESVLMALPKGADQIRLYHPTIMIFDEAAYLDEFEAAYGAALPVCRQIIAVSSVAPGWFWEKVRP